MPPRQTPAELEGQGPPTAPDAPGVSLGAFDPYALGGAGAVDRVKSGAAAFDDWLDGLFGGSLAQRNSDGVPLGAGVPMTGMGGTGTVEALVSRVSNLNAAEISYLQRRLYQGGFFPAGAYTNSANITWGVWDPTSMQALTQAIESASVNRVDNFDRFLDEQRIRFAQEGTTASDGRNVGAEIEGSKKARVFEVELTDPDSIRLLAEASASELLGRKPTEKELAAITAKIHQRQRDSQQARARDATATMETTGGLEENARLLQGQRDYDLWIGDGTDAPDLDAEQRKNVSIIMQVAADMGLGDEYVLAAISAGIVESGLRNIGYGDRDSIGMYQQRDHYGTKAQRMDPYWSTQKFFEEALRYDGETIGEWVANTQRPAKQYRGRYDEVMGQASAIFARISGRTGAKAAEGRSGAGAERAAEASSGVGDPIRIWDPVTKTYKVHHRPSETVNPATGQANPALTFGGPIQRQADPDAPAGAFWLDSMMGSSGSDPIFREAYSVNPGDIAEMELRRLDPKAYETKQAASRAVEFFSLLGAGGGMTGALPE